MTVGNVPLPTDLINQTSGAGLLTGLGRWANNATDGWFWLAILITFGIVLYITTASRFNSARAFGYAGFATMMGAVMMGIINLLAWKYVTLFIIVGVAGFVAMIMSER